MIWTLIIFFSKIDKIIIMTTKKTKAILTQVIKEAKKLNKAKKGSDLTCGKVVCY
jgi:hypothetical protein